MADSLGTNVGRSSQQSERGQALALFAASLVALCGFVGLSVDVGQIFWTKAELQKAADAAAFASARELPNTQNATTIALQYVGLNSTFSTTADITFSKSNRENDTIHVVAKRQVSFYFLKVLGIDGQMVSAKATGINGVYSGGTGIMPWGLIPNNTSNSRLLSNPCFVSLDSEGLPIFRQKQNCVLEYGAGENAGGDFGSLALDKNGGDEYRENVRDGSTSQYIVGDQVEAQTGAMTGPTKFGIQDRLAKAPPPGCPSNNMSDVLRDNPDGTVSLNTKCIKSPRIVIIPVVDQIANPAKSTIKGFAFMFLLGVDGTGGHAKVLGQFVSIVTPLPGGVYILGDDRGASASLLR